MAVGSLPMQPAGPSRENLTQQATGAMSSLTMQPASSVCVLCSLTMEPASAMGSLTMQPARAFRENLTSNAVSQRHGKSRDAAWKSGLRYA